MTALKMILAGGIGLAALGAATPAAAQYYPQPNGGYGYNNNVVGQVIGQILNPNSYGRYPYANYGYNQYANQGQARVRRSTSALAQSKRAWAAKTAITATETFRTRAVAMAITAITATATMPVAGSRASRASTASRTA